MTQCHDSSTKSSTTVQACRNHRCRRPLRGRADGARAGPGPPRVDKGEDRRRPGAADWSHCRPVPRKARLGDFCQRKYHLAGLSVRLRRCPSSYIARYSPQENDFRTGLPFVGKGLPTYPRIFFWKPICACSRALKPNKNPGQSGIFFSGNRLRHHTYRTASSSYSCVPAGVCTSTSSPSSLPISARAMGELTETSPCLMSASSSPTIW